MKHSIFGMALLLLAALCGPSIQADSTYTASTSLTMTSKGPYTVYPPATTAAVSFLVQSQFVEISGAAPATPFTISWSMTDTTTAFGRGVYIDNDYSKSGSVAGPVSVMTDKNDTFHRNVNDIPNGTGLAITLNVRPGNDYTTSSGSVLTDSSGHSYAAAQSIKFSVVQGQIS